MSEEAEDFLAHYGVLGMRWGVSKNDSRKSSTRTKVLANAATVSLAGGIGTALVGLISKNPSTRIGASFVSFLLSTTAVALDSAESLSDFKDTKKRKG